ncbi:hypothetical protein T07_4308 [Trichinella nelsoni]|uniref:Uncharacterized protein n=1 Tax=Trichinella nelsoni TaxID=6336 RepID=A0A0V0RJ94_9BILA|nr:hypothetical protein T07_4308 [Trichinella nelsoni]
MEHIGGRGLNTIILINYFVLNVKCVFFIFFAHIYICGGGLTALLIALERLGINCGCEVN